MSMYIQYIFVTFYIYIYKQSYNVHFAALFYMYIHKACADSEFFFGGMGGVQEIFIFQGAGRKVYFRLFFTIPNFSEGGVWRSPDLPTPTPPLDPRMHRVYILLHYICIYITKMYFLYMYSYAYH